jgi:hypothetical protein
MANPFNLAAGGGWELRVLRQPPSTAKKPKARR